MGKRLPILDQPASSIDTDGHRNYVHPADVSGRFTTLRTVVSLALIGVYVALPFVKIGGRPAVFLDIVHRRFHLFGATFNANDFWLVFFLITGIGFALIVLTSVLGRVWCGFACPQTVFLDGIFRRIERLIDGPRNERIRRARGPLTFDKAWRFVTKNAIFLALCFALAHVFLSYFVSLPSLATIVREPPSAHPEAFGWVVAFTLVTFADFAWFREQVCLIICPYGRLQSVMTDRDTIVIGYDEKRGEPRGRATDPQAGDCVDCHRCVQVCPTGIDIRNGLQIDCIGCAACVDACDEVMTRIDRPVGLIRYDSQNRFDGGVRRLLRPRVVLYAVLGVVGLSVGIFAASGRVAFEAHLLRSAGAVFVATDADVQNPVRLHLVNKRDEPIVLDVVNRSDAEISEVPEVREVRLAPGEARYVPILLTVSRERMRPGLSARLDVSIRGERDEHARVDLRFLGPVRRTR